MTGESNLATLLLAMRPILHPGAFAFCSVAASNFADLPSNLLAPAVGLFHESEGVTVVLPVADAEAAGLPVGGAWALITLSVHSNLNAVGFLAALTARLADAGISVNAISAYYHDHLFVPWDARTQAMRALAAFVTTHSE